MTKSSSLREATCYLYSTSIRPKFLSKFYNHLKYIIFRVLNIIESAQSGDVIIFAFWIQMKFSQ